MKRLGVVLVLLIFALSASSARAVDLTAGSYASLGGAVVYYDGDFRGEGVAFSLVPGNYGPFQVIRPQYTYDWTVQVPATATSVAPGTSLYALPDRHNVERIYRVAFGYTSNYDANQMRLELISTDFSGNPIQVWWSQSTSGLTGGLVDVACYIPADQMAAFRVIAIPEPSSLSILLPLLSGAAMMRRRRR